MRSVIPGILLSACGGGVHSDPTNVTTLVTGQSQPTWIAIDTDSVWFVDAFTDTIPNKYDLLRAPKAGGTAQLIEHGTVIMALTADDTGVYWLDDAQGCHVMGLAHGASTPTTLGIPASGIYCTFRNLATDRDAVYVSDDQATVWRVPKSGTGAIELGKTDTTVGAIAVDSNGLWVATLHGAKHFAPTGTADPELVFAQRPPDELFVDGGALFAVFAGTGGADGSIMRVPASGQPTTIAANITLPIQVLAQDAELYIATNNLDAGIWRVPESGGDLTQLAAGKLPGGMAVDAEYLYWTDSPLGEIRRLAR